MELSNDTGPDRAARAGFWAWLKAGRHRRWVLIALGVLLVLRLCLSFAIKTEANHVLEHMDPYRGHIDDVGLSLWRGAYQFRGVKIETIGGKVPLPLFASPNVDIALQWGPLLHGQWVASVSMDQPSLNFVTGPSKDTTQFGFEQDWFDIIHQLVVIKINRLQVEGGQIRFADPYQQPPLDMHLDRVEGVLEGLRMERDPTRPEDMPGGLSVTAQLMDEAPLHLAMGLDAFAAKPTFDYTVTLEDLDLARLDLLFNTYLGVDVAGGQLSIYSEGKSDEGQFKGYLKPLVKHLKVMKPHEKLSPKLAKKALVGLLAWIFKNHPHDLDATKITFSGELSGPKAGIDAHLWRAFGGLLGNAFIKAVPAKLDRETDLHEFKAP